MPIIPQHTLQKVINGTISNYGHILEYGIYKEHGWFTGSGYVYINRAASNAPLTASAKQSPPLPLNHTIEVKLKYSDDHTWIHKMYATWSRMPLFCRYCHLPGHNKLTCTSKPQPRCHHYQGLGHLRKQCPVKHAVHETYPSKDSSVINNRSAKRHRSTSPRSTSPITTPNTQDNTSISADDFPTLPSSTQPYNKADLKSNEHSASHPSNDAPSPNTELQDVVMTSQQEPDSRPPDP